MEVYFFKKKKKEGFGKARLFVVKKVNDIWVRVKVCLGAIMHYCVKELYRKLFLKDHKDSWRVVVKVLK